MEAKGNHLVPSKVYISILKVLASEMDLAEIRLIR
jgi:hypothetical protein